MNLRQIIGEDLHEDGDLGFELPDEILEGLEDEAVWNPETRTRDDVPAAILHNSALCRAHGHVYEQPSKPVMKAIRELIFETVEADNNTDYFATYLLKDGKFEVVTGSYDCGY